MIECPICGVENEPQAGSCRNCSFALSLLGPTILDGASVAIAPEATLPPAASVGVGEQPRAVPAAAQDGAAAVAEMPLLEPAALPAPPATSGDVDLPDASGEPAAAGELTAKPAGGPDVDGLLKTLRSREPYYVRLGALRQLGRIEASTPEIVRELLLARGVGDWEGARDLAVREISQLAARLLDSSPHREVLQQHPELVEAVTAELRRRAPWIRTAGQPPTRAPEAKERASSSGLLGDVVDAILSLLKLFFD